jgi:hypothetical protein
MARVFIVRWNLKEAGGKVLARGTRTVSGIEAHICISFTAYAYTIYKELERVLYKNKSTISLKQAAELTHNIYEPVVTLPQSKQRRKIVLRLDENY